MMQFLINACSRENFIGRLGAYMEVSCCGSLPGLLLRCGGLGGLITAGKDNFLSDGTGEPSEREETGSALSNEMRDRDNEPENILVHGEGWNFKSLRQSKSLWILFLAFCACWKVFWLYLHQNFQMSF